MKRGEFLKEQLLCLLCFEDAAVRNVVLGSIVSCPNFKACIPGTYFPGSLEGRRGCSSVVVSMKGRTDCNIIVQFLDGKKTTLDCIDYRMLLKHAAFTELMKLARKVQARLKLRTISQRTVNQKTQLASQLGRSRSASGLPECQALCILGKIIAAGSELEDVGEHITAHV